MTNISAMNIARDRTDHSPGRRYAIITLTGGALSLGRRLCAQLANCDLYVNRRFGIAPGQREIHIDEPLDSLAEKLFHDYDSLIWIMASGIVVRSIARSIAHKAIDPAVLIIDEKGRFVISLLSGHLGRANADAERVAALIQGTAIITTASDVTSRIAVDALAMAFDCVIDDLDDAKRVTAEIVNNAPVALVSPFPPPVRLPENLHLTDLDAAISGNFKALIIISQSRPGHCHSRQVWLIPRCIVAGIGCRQGKCAEKILAALDAALAKSGVDRRALRNLVSIDLKAKEPGLLAAAEVLQVPLRIISRNLIRHAPIDFYHSDFVQQHVGVGGICEPAALIDSMGTLILPKQKYQGVTVALARTPWPVCEQASLAYVSENLE